MSNRSLRHQISIFDKNKYRQSIQCPRKPLQPNFQRHRETHAKTGKDDIARDILDARHAGIAKSIAKQLKPTNVSDDLIFMMKLLIAKVEQCDDFRGALRATVSWKIIHSTRPTDTFWASGLLPSEDHKTYTGQNVYGRMLEMVRSSLRSEDTYKKKEDHDAPRPLMKVPSRRIPLLPHPGPANRVGSPNGQEIYFQEYPLPGPLHRPYAYGQPFNGGFYRGPPRGSHAGLSYRRSQDCPESGCTRCGEPHHVAAECWFKDKIPKCRNCGREGHKMKFCRLGHNQRF